MVNVLTAFARPASAETVTKRQTRRQSKIVAKKRMSMRRMSMKRRKSTKGQAEKRASTALDSDESEEEPDDDALELSDEATMQFFASLEGNREQREKVFDYCKIL